MVGARSANFHAGLCMNLSKMIRSRQGFVFCFSCSLVGGAGFLECVHAPSLCVPVLCVRRFHSRMDFLLPFIGRCSDIFKFVVLKCKSSLSAHLNTVIFAKKGALC